MGDAYKLQSYKPSQHAERQRHRWFSGRMLASQFHWSSARAARVRFPADAVFLLGGGRGRGGGEQTNRVISLHLSRKGGLKKNFSPAGNRTPVFRVTGGDTHHYTTEEVNM